MEHQEILHRCFRCGYCKMPSNFVDINCPSYLKFRFESFAPGGRMWLLRAWLDKEIETSDRLQTILFSCASCGNCVEHCVMPKFKDQILEAFTAARAELVEQGKVPPSVRDFLTRVQKAGNAYGISPKKRGDWAKDLDVPEYDGQEYLFFVGDVGSLDPLGQEKARSAVQLLQKWGVSLGILGSAECSEGNDVAACGEADLFQYLAEKNIKTFQDRGASKIICFSPHSFNALKNMYPPLGATAQVFHYTQVLALLAQSADWNPDARPQTVTYHDPCYLGRHNQEFFAARMALKAAPGITLVEMPRNKKNALCCGGGGGNVFTSIVSGGVENSARARVREALDTGAQLLAVSCPSCAVMLDEAAKTEGVEDRIKIMELSEVLSGQINS